MRTDDQAGGSESEALGEGLEVVDLPPLPVFDQAKRDKCIQSGDGMPLVFEWFKYLACLAVPLSNLSRKNAGFKPVPELHLGILRGLINRCVRLMLSMLKLAHDRKCGETLAILMRCIAETAITIQWLCKTTQYDAFAVYVADSLRTDGHLRDLINRTLASRGGVRLPIEDRMLASIQRHADAAKMHPSDVDTVRRQPKFFEMCTAVGHGERFYVAVQRIGSHAIHGTSADLLFHYIEQDENGCFATKANTESTPSHNQLAMPALVVAEALMGYARHVLAPGGLLALIERRCNGLRDALIEFEHELEPDSVEPLPPSP